MIQGPTESPDAGKGEIGLIDFTRGFRRNIFWYQKAVEQSAECLNEKKGLLYFSFLPVEVYKGTNKCIAHVSVSYAPAP